ncbi:hypothetical protein BDC45DRAFT_514108 [Circinella umbellata]|nr:hypothetical protein BDC45DRAFT_514108 [Circinella umbellata]
MSDIRSFEIERSRRRSESYESSFLGEDNDDNGDGLMSTTSPALSNIHSTTFSNSGRYRSLVNESPPANFNEKTPQDDQYSMSGIKQNITTLATTTTPSPSKQSEDKIPNFVPSPIKQPRSNHSSPVTREMRTPSEWDELMRSKGIIPPTEGRPAIVTRATTGTSTTVLPERHKTTTSPMQPRRPVNTTTTSDNVKKQPVVTTMSVPREKKSDIPSYMRATESYESRLHRTHSEVTKSQRQRHVNTKPRFQSSTQINAMDDIHNEMRDEDIYIPLAVRIKLFEQNLRNGNPITTSSRSTGSTTHRQNKTTDTHHSSTTSLSSTRPRSPRLLTRHRTYSSQQSSQSSSQEKRQPLTTEQTNSSTKNRRTRTLSRHTRPRTTAATTSETTGVRNSYKERGGSRTLTSSTLSSANKATSRPSSKAVTTDRGDSKSNKRQKTTHHQPTTVQPFRFATDQRALHHQKQFKAKLDLWKEKEDEERRTSASGQLHRGTKRKVQEEN